MQATARDLNFAFERNRACRHHSQNRNCLHKAHITNQHERWGAWLRVMLQAALDQFRLGCLRVAISCSSRSCGDCQAREYKITLNAQGAPCQEQSEGQGRFSQVSCVRGACFEVLSAIKLVVRVSRFFTSGSVWHPEVTRWSHSSGLWRVSPEYLSPNPLA